MMHNATVRKVPMKRRMRKDDVKPTWNVWYWNFNTDRLEQYDVVPAVLRELKSLKKKEFPDSHDSLDEFLKRSMAYNFWAKCEWEMIVHSWPALKNDQKVDVYDQLKLNWDVFVDVIWKYVELKKGKI